MLLRQGPVLPQLAYEFEDEEVACTLVATYQLPAVLDGHRFRQLVLRPKQMHEHRESSPLMLFRSMLLLPSRPEKSSGFLPLLPLAG